MRAGDTVTIEIERIGALTNPVVLENAAPGQNAEPVPTGVLRW
jgi:fumarylacetoacetate (FAA) hydrolase family protein